MSEPDGAFRYSLGFFGSFAVAMAFFTRLPVDPRARGDWKLADSAWAFPLVGAGIGAATALVFLLAQLLGLVGWLAGLLAVLASVAITGALHEDGLADTADGLFGSHDREARLAIMRDSRHGSFGVLAIVLSVLLRAAALAAIGDVIHGGMALIAAHAASRAPLPAVMRALPAARADGLSATAGTPGTSDVAAAAAIGAVVTLTALGPMRGAIALCIVGLAIFAVARFAQRRVGGHTGDILGAIEQTGEIVMLLAASAR
jgi:adenosylcobinamide-GDP ribazoletransferase